MVGVVVVVDTLVEAVATLLQELWLLAAQLLNLWCALWLRVLRAQDHPTNTTASPHHQDARAEYATYFDKATTGLCEDLLLAALTFLERCRVALRGHHRLHSPRAVAAEVGAAAAGLLPWRVWGSGGVDTRTTEALVAGCGYPYARYDVTTGDSYALLLERIPRPGSRSCVYFQHGIMDSSFGWVCCGNVGSPAFLAYDRGYDVFLGTLRGNGGSYNKPAAMAASSYWDFSLDHHALFDLPAFVEQIHHIKQQEGVGEAELQFVVVAHSLGAAAVLAYLVSCGLREVPPRLTKGVLLSPAGCHPQLPLSCHALGALLVTLAFPSTTTPQPTSSLLLPKLTHVRVGQEWLRVGLAKAFRDIHRHPAARRLCCFVVARYFVGGDVSDLPLQHVHNLLFNVLHAGVAMGVVRQLWDNYRRGVFASRDYGPEGNLRQYGCPTAVNFCDNYAAIPPLPIHLVAGASDTLIPPACVRQHYDALQRGGHPCTTFKVVSGGHAELTMRMSEEALDYLFSLL